MSEVAERAKAALEGVPADEWTHIGGGHIEGRNGIPIAKVWGHNKAGFIAAARTLVPELIAEIEDIQTQLTFARDGFSIWPMTEVESNLMTQVLELRKRLAAKSNIIATPEELAELPEQSVVRNVAFGVVLECTVQNDGTVGWTSIGDPAPRPSVLLPAVLVWHPDWSAA